MNSFRNASSDTKGFSLVEILLGITIFSLIALSLYSVFFGGISLSQNINEKNKSLREARWIFDRIEKDISNIVAYDFSGSYPDKKSFSASNGKMEFFIRTDQGLKAVRYSFRALNKEKIHKVIIGKTTKKNEKITTSVEGGENSYMAFIREEIQLPEYLAAGFKSQKEIKKDILNMRMYASSLRLSFQNNEKDWKEQWDQPELPCGVRVELISFGSSGNKNTLDVSRDFQILTGHKVQEKLEEKDEETDDTQDIE